MYRSTGDIQDNFKSFLAKTDITVMPEVDIFEVFGSDDTLVFNLHKWDVKATNNISHTSLDSLDLNRSYTFENSFNLENEFHVYAFEWTPDEVSAYVDGKKYFKTLYADDGVFVYARYFEKEMSHL